MGKAMRATSFDKPTARLMGINVDGVITFTFALGAGAGRVAGVLYAIAYPQSDTFHGHHARPEGIRGGRVWAASAAFPAHSSAA